MATATRPRPVQAQAVAGWAGRLGLAARGVIYLLVATLAVAVAAGRPAGPSDRQGALQAVARQPAGRLLVVVMAVGFALFAAWQVVRVVTGRGDGASGDDAGAATRIAAAGTAGVYAAATVSAIRLAGGHASKDDDASAKQWTAKLMAHGGGRPLVALVGMALLVAGVVFLVRGLKRRSSGDMDLVVAGDARRVVEVLGAIGFAARGLVVMVAGGFLIDAAVTFDPQKARGLDGSLRALAGAPGGPLLLIGAALGLACFGLWSLAAGWWLAAPTGRDGSH